MRHILKAAMCLALITLGCVTAPQEQTAAPVQTEKAPAETGSEDVEDSAILEIAGQHPEGASFVAENPEYQYEITALEPDELGTLAEKYPVIYGDLPQKTLYKIDYKGDRGMLVIVDVEGKQVLKYFRTAGVNLG